MRAVVFSSFGDESVLSVEDIDLPKIGPGQVLIRVEAAAVNPADLAARAGAFGSLVPPGRHVPGWDVAGIVAETAPDVTAYAEGDSVVGMSDWLATRAGTQAEHVTLDASALAPAPVTVPSVEAATLPANALTAVQALDLLDLAPGQVLAVTGAGGAVGGYAMELALLRGLRVVGIGSAHDEPFVTALGAEFLTRPDAGLNSAPRSGSAFRPSSGAGPSPTPGHGPHGPDPGHHGRGPGLSPGLSPGHGLGPGRGLSPGHGLGPDPWIRPGSADHLDRDDDGRRRMVPDGGHSARTDRGRSARRDGGPGTDLAAAWADMPRVDGLVDTAVVGAPALGMVHDGGTYVGVRAPAAPTGERGIRVVTVSVRSDGAALRDLVSLVDDDRLTLRVADTFAFEEAAEAHVLLARPGTRGRPVLIP